MSYTRSKRPATDATVSKSNVARVQGFIKYLLVALIVCAAASVAAAQTVVYNSIEAPLASSYESVGFEATSASELGDYIHLAGSDRVLKSVTVTMVDWAKQSDYPALPAGSWTHPITLNVYKVGPMVGGLHTKGSRIATITQNQAMLWRPEADPACTGPDSGKYLGSDNVCHNGFAFNISFDLSGLAVSLPDNVIIGVAYNTQHFGASPIGSPGPYNSLNVAANPGPASVGADDDADRVFYNTSFAGFYTDGGSAGVGVFREDTGWGPLNGNIPFQITAAPEVVTNVGANSLTPTKNFTQWFFYNDETDAIDNNLGSFVVGPGTPPLGVGSAKISVSGTQRRNLATYQFSGTPLANIGTLKFSTYNPSAGNGGGSNRSGYLNFNVDFNSSDTFQGRLAYVPSQNGTIVPDQWKEWDAIDGGNALWNYSHATWPAGIGGGGEPGSTLKSWSQILAQYPNARILVTDSWLGIRVGEPDASGYTENIDKIQFGTNGVVKTFNFDPLPTTVYVDDNWAGTAVGADPDGAGPATSFGYDAFSTIQSGINGVDVGGTVNVAAGTYSEDVTASKTVILNGAGPTGVNVIGPIGGPGATFTIAASGVEIKGFTITRAGNNTTDWNNANLNIAGVAVQGQAITGLNLHNNLITGMRTAIDINNSNGHSIHNNVIDDNHTGMIMRNQTDSLNVSQNQITNNRTVGVLFLDGSSGTNSPVQTCSGCTFFNNNISGNWYGQIVDRQSGGSIPAPGTTNLKNFSGNWYGTASPAVTTANSAEPGYSSLIPVEYGGSATAPGGQPDIAGPASANFDYSPYLVFGGDTDPATYGFQGNFSALNISAGSAQVGGGSKIQEANDLMSAGGILSVPAGTYPGNVNITKAITVKGIFTIAGTLTVSSPGATLSPGNSPGIINSGNLSLTAGSNVAIELNGVNVGSQYDQLNVTGTVNLGGANLNVTTGFTPAAGNTFTIVNNDGADPVVGTFAGLPNNTVFFVGANSFRINYDGGTGNDVVLTAVSLCNVVSIPTNITTLTGNTTVVVPINVDDTTGHGLLSTDFSLSYDPAVLTLTNVNLGTVDGSAAINTNGSGGSKIVSIYQANPFSGAGTLASLTFTAIGAPGTSSAVSFTSFKFNEGTPCVSTSNGLVSVVSGAIAGTVTYGNALIGGGPSPRHVPGATLTAVGSVNVSSSTANDGTYNLSGMGAGSYVVTPSKTSVYDTVSVSGFDAAAIAQYVVGLTSLSANQQTVSDVSGTGGITSFDAALIARYAAGLPNFGTAGNWIFQPVNRSYANVNTDISGQDYTALLMGDVTGNWIDPLATRPTIVFEGKPLEIKAPLVTAASGTELSLPIAIGDTTDKGILSYQFDLHYDSSVLAPAKEAADLADTISSGMTATVNSIEPGVLRVVVFGARPLAGTGSLLNLKFNVIGSVDSQTDLTWDNFGINEGNVNFTAVNGHVQIEASKDASISGRVLTPFGRGLSKASVTVTDTAGNAHSVLTSSTGYFQVAGLSLGETYTITVSERQYRFARQTVALTDNAVSLDIIGQQ